MTRFLILSKEVHQGEGDKCSVTFSTEHKAAALFKALEVFAKEEINLTRIESVPSEPGSYAFFLDFMGSIKDEKVTKALAEVQAITINFRLMGCYKERKVV
jgi:prephenate dehydratase